MDLEPAQQAVDADAWDVTARSAGDAAPDPAAGAPDTDEAVAASARDAAGQA